MVEIQVYLEIHGWLSIQPCVCYRSLNYHHTHGHTYPTSKSIQKHCWTSKLDIWLFLQLGGGALFRSSDNEDHSRFRSILAPLILANSRIWIEELAWFAIDSGSGWGLKPLMQPSFQSRSYIPLMAPNSESL